MIEFALKHPGSQNKMQKPPYHQLQEVEIGVSCRNGVRWQSTSRQVLWRADFASQVTLGKVRDNLWVRGQAETESTTLIFPKFPDKLLFGPIHVNKLHMETVIIWKGNVMRRTPTSEPAIYARKWAPLTNSFHVWIRVLFLVLGLTRESEAGTQRRKPGGKGHQPREQASVALGPLVQCHRSSWIRTLTGKWFPFWVL